MTTSGPRSPTSASSGGGSVVSTWNNPTNIYSDNSNRASVTFIGLLGTTVGGMPWLYGSNYGFNIPSNATITGITVQADMRRNGGLVGEVMVQDIFLIKTADTPVGATRGNSTYVATTDTVYTYGGDGDLWGTTWTPAEINSANFGFALRPISNDVLATRTFNVDHVAISVHYKINTSVPLDKISMSETLNNTSHKFRFEQPSTTTVMGDGTTSAFWYNLPIPTRLRSKQITSWGADSEDDFLIYDGSFELVIGYVGQMEIRLDADEYEQQFTLFTAI